MLLKISNVIFLLTHANEAYFCSSQTLLLLLPNAVEQARCPPNTAK